MNATCRFYFFDFDPDPDLDFEDFDDEDLFFGTFAPLLRASESPIAIACFRLVTFVPDRPLLSVPFFFSCIARFTFAPAFFPYFAMTETSFECVD